MASSSQIPPPAPLWLGGDLGSTAATTHESAADSPSREVLFEILSWLPEKSLSRCRCVSKAWRALVSTPAFAAAQRSRAEPLLVGMCGCMSRRTLQLMDTGGTIVKAEVKSLRRAHNWTLQATLGDLVCVSLGYRHSGTLVVDIATGKTLLACSEDLAAAGRVPIEQYACFGFGRAAQSGSLKLFRLALPRPGDHTQTCQVLTLGGDGGAKRWRQTRSPPRKAAILCGGSGVPVNGALHFLSEDRDDVLSFNLDNEKWKVIHGPHGGVVGCKETLSLAELEGNLCMARLGERAINIWLLSDPDRSVWIKAYKIPKRWFSEFVVPLRVLPLGRKLLLCYYDYTTKPILQVYDPSSGKCTMVKLPTNLVGRVRLVGSSNLRNCYFSGA